MRTPSTRVLPLPVALFAAALLAAPARAQTDPPPFQRLAYDHDSGAVDNPTARERVVIAFTVESRGASWLRLYFDDVQLAGDVLAGTGARLRLTGHRDGAVMEMNALHLAQWRSSSCYFNGDRVEVEVVAPAWAGPSRVVMRAIDAGLPPVIEATICDTVDDRVLSSDPRAARLLPIGCTGWLIEDCAKCFLTAGHCSGNLGVAEFNVPLSNPDGSIVHPPPEDQYSIDPASLQTNGGQGVGDDWAYFGAFANSNTGLTPYQAQGGAFTLALPPTPPNGNDIRITGYGTDDSPNQNNQVQQTNVGPMVVSNPTAEVGYRTDTTGGNSGSPVIWEQTGEAVGIHTHGGCDAGGAGNNWGTGSGHPGLQAALASPQGICAAGFSFPAGLPDPIPPGVPTTLVANALSSNPANVTLWYRYDGGAYVPIPMTLAGGQTWTADLPPPSCSDEPEFYFSLDDASCGTVTSPPGAPADVYSARVGTEVTVFADDFEADQGWTTVNLGAATGDWQRGVPVDDPSWDYDPAADADGSGSCYLTQNELGNTDVDDGAVQLESPDFDFSAGGLVSYAYYLYLTNTDGTDRLLVEASDNGAAGPWVEVARHDTNGGTTWRTHAITDADFLAAGLSLTATMRLRFTANDGDSQSVVEAGLDAFSVGRIDCDGEIGTTYCSPAVDNSTGGPAVIQAFGSVQVADGDVTLVASAMPPDRFGYFLTSATQGFVQNPGGSQGNLCLAGQIGRYAKDVQSSGPGGTFDLALDLGQLPPPLNVAVQPGDTWNFTTWFRDKNPGDTSNFTDAVSIVFQ